MSRALSPWERGRVVNSVIEFTRSGPETLIRYVSTLQPGQYYQAFADEEVVVLKDDLIELHVPTGQIPKPLSQLPAWPRIVARLEEKYGVSFTALTEEEMELYPALKLWSQASHVNTVIPTRIIDWTRKIDYLL
jgi:hypothetical protein